MKYFTSLILLIGVTSCAVKNDDNGDSTAQRRQNDKITALYGPLTGKYSGKMTATDHGAEDVDLLIYLASSEATNPDGTPATGRLPIAVFKRNRPVVGDYVFNLTGYTPETGQLDMAIAKSMTTNLYSIDAQVIGQRIVGRVQTVLGTLGTFDVGLVSKDTGSRDDADDRLFRAYQAVEGVYRGWIDNGANSQPKKCVQIDLTAIMNGRSPMLLGYYRRPDIEGGVIDLSMSVVYRPDKSPPEISLNGHGLGSYILDINGTLVDDQITAQVNSQHEGLLGLMKAKRLAPGEKKGVACPSDKPKPTPMPKPKPKKPRH